MFGSFRRIPGAGKPKYEVLLGETKLLIAPKVKVAKRGSVTLDDDQIGYEQVKMRRLGDRVVWISAVAPNFRVFGESALWFSVADIRSFAESFSKAPDEFISELSVINDAEVDHLLRAAVAAAEPESGRVLPAPSWPDLVARRKYSVSEPADCALEGLAARIDGAAITLHEVRPDEPPPVASLLESYEFTTGEQQLTRLVAASSGEYWHIVGSGCWGRITLE